jgi:membrane protease YdiL (CAAX protease family)
MSKPLGAFIALTFVISWAIWLAMVAGSVSIETTVGLVLNVIATAGPTIAALILAIAMGRGELRRLLRGFRPELASPRWAFVAVLLPLAMIAVAIAVSVGAFGAPVPVITAGVLGVLVVEFVRILFQGGPLEEELGWRGFALPRLQVGRSAFSASVLLGLVWGVWHIPLYFVSGTGQEETAAATGAVFGIAAFVIWTIGLSILFTWLFNQTQGSLIVVILLHAAVNLGAFVPAAVGSTGAASFLYAIVTWIVALVVAARFGHEHLASRPRVTAPDPVSATASA